MTALVRLPVQWVAHGTINCKQTPRLPLQRAAAAQRRRRPTSVSPRPSLSLSPSLGVDAPPMGFSFTASAKGVPESESESGWAPLKLDAICVQLGYANLTEPGQSLASLPCQGASRTDLTDVSNCFKFLKSTRLAALCGYLI